MGYPAIYSNRDVLPASERFEDEASARAALKKRGGILYEMRQLGGVLGDEECHKIAEINP